MASVNHLRRGARVTWARVEDGFHVGSRDGDFLGYIERTAARQFEAFDRHSRRVGLFGDLTTAMRELAAERPEILVQVRAESDRWASSRSPLAF